MVSIPLLKKFYIFEGLTEGELGRIAPLCREKVYEAGEVIFQEGEVAKDLCLVVDGKVALEMKLQPWPHAPIRHTTVDLITRGETFGWSALVEPHILTLSARCLTKTKVIAIDGSELRRLLDTDCHMGYEVMGRLSHVVASRLRDTTAKLMEFLRGEELAHEYTPEEATLIQRVQYFIRFRWITVIGIVVLALLANKILHIGFPLMPVLLLAAVIAIYNLLFSLEAKRLALGGPSSIVPKARSFVQIQSTIDLVAFILLFHYTRGLEN
ncbi:MAG: cyclic nucleotide-binding domain-containing protein, partial [Dehalococcoidia bacterium]